MSAVEQFYSRWARLYDLVATAPGVESWRVQAADALALEGGETVVEMGCGTGANLPYLRERVGERGRVVGVDRTRGMLGRARERVREHGWENVHLVRGDATAAPVAAADAVLATFLVGLLPDPAAAVEEWLDCLDSGRVVLLNAGRSDASLAAPLNLLFRAFVRVGAAGNRLARDSPARALEAKFEQASAALARRAHTHGTRRLGLGYVRLAWGEV